MPAMTPQRDHLAGERASMPSLDLHRQGVTPSTPVSHEAVPVTIDTTSRGTQASKVVREDQHVEHLKRQLAIAHIIRDSWKRQAQRQDITKQLSRAVQECDRLKGQSEKVLEMIKTWQTAHARSLMTPPWMRALEEEVQAEADTFQQAPDHDASLHQQWLHCRGRVLNYVEAFRQHRVVYEHLAGEKKELENIVLRQTELLTRLRLEKATMSTQMPTTPGSEAESEGKACTYHPTSKVSTPLGATHSGMAGHTQAQDMRLALNRATGQDLASFTEFYGLNGLSPIQVSII